MRTLDLFSGIGGFALAARWMGWDTAAFIEINPFCQKVLAKNFPSVPVYDDIKLFDYEQEKEKIGSIDPFEVVSGRIVSGNSYPHCPCTNFLPSGAFLSPK